MSLLSHLWPTDDAHAVVVASTVVVTTLVYSLLRAALWPPTPSVIRGPLHTVLPTLSERELEVLEYKTDAFPGARDVDTPYGMIRVYEWGPDSGPKVLLVHGISTTCQTLGKLAHGLVAHGCRVMLFDLFGRGFSDGVGDLPHDARLYVSQMLLALASSPLPWTGAGALGVVGYSLGGGVAVHFAAAFPALVARLVLLAPAGLIRRAKFGPLTRFLFTAGLVPDRLLAPLTARRLKRPIAAGIRKPPPPSARDIKDHHHLLYVQDALAEASDPPSAAASETSIEKAVLRYVEWMVAHHAGFVPAFIGCVRGAPLYDQHATFAKLAARPPGSTLVVLGAADEIVAADEYERDALPLLGGRERVRWVVVDAGHDLPMTRAAEVLEAICNAWGLFQRPDAA